MVVIDLTKDGFIANVGDFEANPKDWKYIGSRPCLIDFHAPWCGYCKRLSPILDEFAKEFDGKIYIYKVDVDQEEALETAFNIRTIPTLMFCPLDGPREMMIGTMARTSVPIMAPISTEPYPPFRYCTAMGMVLYFL